MNSVFSAFKTNKGEKHHQRSSGGSGSNSTKKILNVQDNSYENLRQIREIGSASKMMSSVIVSDDIDGDLMLRGRVVIKQLIDSDLDVVDHATSPSSDHSMSFIETNGLKHTELNNSCNSVSSNSSNSQNCDNLPLSLIKSPRRTTPNLATAEDDDESDSIAGGCTSSSSELSNNTVISSQQQNTTNLSNNHYNSPVKSLSASSCSSSSSCDVTTIVATSPSSLSSSSLPLTNSTSSNSLSNENNFPCETIKFPATTNCTLPIIMSKNRGNSATTNGYSSTQPLTTSSAATTPKSARYSKPRLSISGFNNSSMPSVHGRAPSGPGSAANVTNGVQPKRLSTHQRNLSLDFRSMGILLPPVSQVTNTRINLTQHHRNRSLDSALHRIPEVEVSSPNAESENTFCTNSILSSTMCSKIVTSSSTNPQNTPIASNVTSPTVIEPCTRPKSSESGKTSSNAAESNLAQNSENKKREDLTSLGSDDSGIICGSESDQVSLNRIRQSHESLDSGEMDPEEECIEILETTSMDEEYRMLQSDLCFYQTPERDYCTLKARKKHSDSDDSNIDDRTRFRDRNISQASIALENHRICVPIDIEDCQNGLIPDSSDLTPTSQGDEVKTLEQSKQETKPEHIKNDIIFKSLFGATKNAIFRTAQSIIDNHEKKNAAKNNNKNGEDSTNVKSPTEFSKKKEFFVLKSSAKKSAAAAATANETTQTPTSPVSPPALITASAMPTATLATASTQSSIILLTPPEIEVKPMAKSNSISSLNRLQFPGVVKCFIREKEQSQPPTKTEKGPSGLLRFFESPVFNIHFAVHYLFYSKEPGVLSFIGNKIFSFPDQEADLYIPQLIVMYIQMDELAEVLDPYLTIRCRKSVDFSLKCLWLLEAYNYQIDTLSPSSIANKKNLSLMKELYSKKERKKTVENQLLSPIKKTHHRSQSDATVLLSDSRRFPSAGTLSIKTATPAKLCLGDLTSGRAFDNGCICFESVRGTVNDLLGHKTVCCCGAPKTAPQKEFMKALINIGKNLTVLQTKTEKTSALRMFLNLINKNLPARVWLPLHSDIPHHIVRITEEKTAVLNSKDKTPYIIYVEVVEVSDIYSSPVILKMMPTLRHTKSEEHLESKDNGSCCSCSNNGKKVKLSESSSNSENVGNELHVTEDDVWSQEDDYITAQYLNLHKICERDAVSQMSLDSCDSRDQGIPTFFNIGDVRTRHCSNLTCENTKSFNNDPEDPSAAALKEPWHEKEKQIRESSPYGHLSNWRLLSAIVKCGDDLRQELMATQLLQMFKIIWEEENVGLWVRPYKIVCLSDDSGLIEPILNTVSLHQIKKNSNKSLRDYFIDEYGEPEGENFKRAQKNFVQSCAAYCLISYLLQVKDRHNGNILLHCDGHLIHIDFGFILSISPKNLGFEQSPFKLTPEFVEVMDGTSSELWNEFNHLLLKGLMAARKHMDRIINLVEIMRSNAQLPCFKNGCSGTVQNLRKRFHMNLTEQELEKKTEQLVQDSLKSLSTKLYDGYQYFTNGIL